jgi:hypothetical protein
MVSLVNLERDSELQEIVAQSLPLKIFDLMVRVVKNTLTNVLLC